MLDIVLDPLRYPFMVRGLLAAAMVGTVCAVAGVYVVLRGMAFFGNALAHSILPGMAVGYMAHGSDRRYLFWWALGAAFFSAFGIAAISQKTRMREDTAIGIVFAGMFALGIALISTVRDFTVDLTHFLFGDILSVSWGDLWLTFIFSAGALLAHALFQKEFKIIAFDPVLARTLRLPARRLNYLQYLILAVVIVVSLQTVGIAMMVAMLIIPAAAASLLTRRLGRMMTLAVCIAVISGAAGLYISYYRAIASGAAIVLTATSIFLLIWLMDWLRKKLIA